MSTDKIISIVFGLLLCVLPASLTGCWSAEYRLDDHEELLQGLGGPLSYYGWIFDREGGTDLGALSYGGFESVEWRGVRNGAYTTIEFRVAPDRPEDRVTRILWHRKLILRHRVLAVYGSQSWSTGELGSEHYVGIGEFQASPPVSPSGKGSFAEYVGASMEDVISLERLADRPVDDHYILFEGRESEGVVRLSYEVIRERRATPDGRVYYMTESVTFVAGSYTGRDAVADVLLTGEEGPVEAQMHEFADPAQVLKLPIRRIEAFREWSAVVGGR